MTIGENIRQRRDHLGWSQRELARRTGIPQANLSRIEAGHNPKVDVMTRIEEVLQDAEAAAPWLSVEGQLVLNLSAPVLRALQKLGATGMFAGTTAEAVAEELLRAAVRDMFRSGSPPPV